MLIDFCLPFPASSIELLKEALQREISAKNQLRQQMEQTELQLKEEKEKREKLEAELQYQIQQ